MSEGNEMSEPVCISPVPEKTLYLAKWSTRFWAWLVDVILIILFWDIVIGIFAQIWVLFPLWDLWHWNFFAFAFETILIFLYWTVLEGFEGRGQSIGKMVMNSRVVNRNGSKINYTTAAI